MYSELGRVKVQVTQSSSQYRPHFLHSHALFKGNLKERCVNARAIFKQTIETTDGIVSIREADHPTLPSSEIPSSFCASTANSIGSCCKTSRAKPLTISATAAS